MMALPSESVGLMEPMLPPDGDRRLEDLAVTLVAEANGLATQLHPIVREEVGNLVRSMNCYYSNLIEGHNTHPRDIDRALCGDYSTDLEKRNLQHEALAHIEVQRIIDLGEPGYSVASVDFIRWLHRDFC